MPKKHALYDIETNYLKRKSQHKRRFVISVMESANSSTFYNRSISEQTFSNSERNVVSKSTFTLPDSSFDRIVIVMCILGIPGNLFAVAVYIRRMTTSIRAYMFALGIADTTICVCLTIMYTVRLVKVGSVIILYVFNACVIFSTCLLAFIATERCMAVAKPHKFTLSTARAKTALAAIGALSICYSAILSATLILRLIRTYVILSTVFVNVCLIIVITSYSVMAVILLKRMKASRRQVDVVAMTRSIAETLATTSTSTSNPTAKSLPTTSRTPGNEVAPTAAKPTKAAQAQRGSLVLFFVTVVFIVCWLPFFLKNYGVPISEHVKRVFVINSVINPFIYSFLSPMFRSDVRQFFRKIRSKLTILC